MVTLYTTHCPMCNVLEKKLKEAKIEFDTVDDKDTVVKIGKENRIMSAPILKVDDNVMNFTDAVKWVNNYANWFQSITRL